MRATELENQLQDFQIQRTRWRSNQRDQERRLSRVRTRQTAGRARQTKTLRLSEVPRVWANATAAAGPASKLSTLSSPSQQGALPGPISEPDSFPYSLIPSLLPFSTSGPNHTPNSSPPLIPANHSAAGFYITINAHC